MAFVFDMAATSEVSKTEVRRRIVTKTVVSESRSAKRDSPKREQPQEVTLDTGTYWLTRILLLRFLGFIYCKFNFHTQPLEWNCQRVIYCQSF